MVAVSTSCAMGFALQIPERSGGLASSACAIAPLGEWDDLVYADRPDRHPDRSSRTNSGLTVASILEGRQIANIPNDNEPIWKII
jgi:hypothetical protein